MNFKQALEAMKQGHKVKLPSWGGYWEYDASINGIVIHCREGNVLYNCTERLLYTAENIISDEWVIANEDNTPILGGKATFSFGEAIKYLKRGFKVARKGWNGKGIYIEMQKPDEHSKMTLPYIYIVTNGLVTNNPDAPRGVVPWLASQTDMLSEDWVFVE